MGNHNYIETALSKRARDFFGHHPATSMMGRLYKFGRFNFDSNLRKRLSGPSGNLDLSKLSHIVMDSGDSEIKLIELCIKLNLTEEEAHETIKKGYKERYKEEDSPFLKKLIGKLYRSICDKLEISIDENFPDW